MHSCTTIIHFFIHTATRIIVCCCQKFRIIVISFHLFTYYSTKLFHYKSLHHHVRPIKSFIFWKLMTRTIHWRTEMTKTMTNTQIHKLEVLERPIMCSYLKFVMSAVSGARVKILTECKKIPEGRENYCFGQQWMYHFKLSVTLGVWYHPWRVILHLMGRLYM